MRKRTGYKQKLRTERTEIEREEINQWLAMRELSEQQWLERVETLPEEHQGTTARMIWWDFWSNRTVAERWTLFDKFLTFDIKEEESPLPVEVLADCLRKVGYPEYRVKLRLIAF